MGAAVILAIDPGSTHSGYALIDADTRRPVEVGKIDNDEVLTLLRRADYDCLAIEMVASYGMPVGKEVFDTVFWIGRYWEHARTHHAASRHLVYRKAVCLHHCGSARAKDANITQALVDRFAPGQPNRGKGSKAQPGWFHGFRADIWAAYALGVYVADTAAA